MGTNANAELARVRWQIRALSRWEGDGGAGCRKRTAATMDGQAEGAPELTDAELVQLRIRMIALENLLIALLADAPTRQLERVREMASYISPRPGFTSHPVTLGAATEMLSLVDRATPFRSIQSGDRQGWQRLP